MQTHTLFRRKNTTRFIRYITVGICAFLAELIIFVILSAVLGAHAGIVLLQTASFIGGLIVSFYGSRTITFKSNKKHFKHKPSKQALAYLIVAIANLFLTNVMLYTLVATGLNVYVAKIAVMVSVVAWNYVIFNKYIFSSSRKV